MTMNHTLELPAPRGVITMGEGGGDELPYFTLPDGRLVLSYAHVAQLPKGDSLGVFFSMHPTVRGQLDCPVYCEDGQVKLGITIESFLRVLHRIRTWAIVRGSGDRAIARWSAGVLQSFGADQAHDDAIGGRR